MVQLLTATVSHSYTIAPARLLGAGVLGDGLGPLGHGVLGQLAGQLGGRRPGRGAGGGAQCEAP